MFVIAQLGSYGCGAVGKAVSELLGLVEWSWHCRSEEAPFEEQQVRLFFSPALLALRLLQSRQHIDSYSSSPKNTSVSCSVVTSHEIVSFKKSFGFEYWNSATQGGSEGKAQCSACQLFGGPDGFLCSPSLKSSLESQDSTHRRVIGH